MNQTIETRCVIAGGGPAGMMLGLLLARSGVDAVVLERHADFLRDFRGDTIHPSTLDLLYELGLLDVFLKRPHQEIRKVVAKIGSEMVPVADFRHLPTHCRFLVLMPQWDFLDFLKQEAQRYPTFHLRMQTEVTELIDEKGAIAGVRAKTIDGTLDVRAPLTIGADGRHSTVRARAGLTVQNLGAPMDVLWMRISRRASDPEQTFGHADQGRILVLLNRDDYWQAAFVIAKGEADRIREKGLPFLRDQIATLEPFLRERVKELQDWNQINLLTVAVDRLERWSRPGLLCIGDAAHAMSPIGGVGINLAVQDAVATANRLARILAHRAPSPSELFAVQRRRTFPTVATQRIQILIQNNAIRKVLESTQPLGVPLPFRLLRRWPMLQRLPARMIGTGFRPEHVRTPKA